MIDAAVGEVASVARAELNAGRADSRHSPIKGRDTEVKLSMNPAETIRAASLVG